MDQEIRFRNIEARLAKIEARLELRPKTKRVMPDENLCEIARHAISRLDQEFTTKDVRKAIDAAWPGLLLKRHKNALVFTLRELRTQKFIELIEAKDVWKNGARYRRLN